MSTGRATLIRPREPQDVPLLVDLLAEQQLQTGYPMRWPLPFPVEQFIVRGNEERAWVAVRAGQVVGHVSVGRVDDQEAAEVFTRETGAHHLACIGVLFVAPAARGSGVGGLLLDTAVAWADDQGRQPVLDVAARHAVAHAVYRHRGWREVGRISPTWLPPGQGPVHLMALPRAATDPT